LASTGYVNGRNYFGFSRTKKEDILAALAFAANRENITKIIAA